MENFNVRNNVLAIRAVAAEFANRIYVPVLITLIIVAFILVVVSIWLVNVNAWWWILAVLIYIAIIVAGIMLVVVRAIISAVNPRQTKTQQSAVKAFVDKLQDLSDITQTPKFILLFRILHDAISSKKKGTFIEATIQNTTSLKSDYANLLRLFSQ